MPAADRARPVSRMPRIRSSGANGWPCDDPDARRAARPVRGRARRRAPPATIVSTSSKKEKSLAWMPLNARLGEVDELRLRRIVGLRPAGRCAWSAGSSTPSERADDEPVRVGRRLRDEVAVGDLAVVAGRQEQVLAALALVGPGDAHVGDVALPDVVDEAQRVRRAPRSPSARRLEVEEVRAVGRSRCSRSARRCAEVARGSV